MLSSFITFTFSSILWLTLVYRLIPIVLSWILIGRTDVEAEAPMIWPTDEKSWLIGKDPDAGKDWRRKEKGMTEDETVG